MKYVTQDSEPTAVHPDPACCDRAGQMWMMDEILIAAWDRRPLPTDAIDRLPPWRARMTVNPLLRDGAATLQHGTPELFDAAARAAGKENARQLGWWRRALDMEPREVLPDWPRSPAMGEPGYVPPVGWKVVRPPAG
ncbi:MAG TPA: hypothetical protein VF657_22255 [Actinoplanes sp.]